MSAGKRAVDTAHMGLFARYLSVWVALCIVLGVALGQLVPAVPHPPSSAPAPRKRFSWAELLRRVDVASNLKWILSSNSVCLMPRPKKETWFMDGALEPGVHYVELRDDLEDVAEQVERWSRDLEGCRRIVQHANVWAARFRNPHVEALLALLVLQRYARESGQLDWA